MTRALAARPWVPAGAEERVRTVAEAAAGAPPAAVLAEIDRLAAENRRIHDDECVNLNPATNVMNPRAEALLSAGLGSRPSLGYPGEKYEMGLEAIEQIEIIAAELAAEVFGARYAEVRVGSGALANLYAFMATCRPGDTIIAPPAERRRPRHPPRAPARPGSYGLTTVPAPVDADGYTIDVDALRRLAHEVRPTLITVGGSLNLFPHPVGRGPGDRRLGRREGALRRGPPVRHGRRQGLAGPAGRGRAPDDHEHLQEPGRAGRRAAGHQRRRAGRAGRRDRVPGADRELRRRPGRRAGRHAARLEGGRAGVRRGDGRDRAGRWPPSWPGSACRSSRPSGARPGRTSSRCRPRPGAAASALARRLRRANLLSCGIGLPLAPVAGDVNGLRIGTPELVRLGATAADMPELAALLAAGPGRADRAGGRGRGGHRVAAAVPRRALHRGLSRAARGTMGP